MQKAKAFFKNIKLIDKFVRNHVLLLPKLLVNQLWN